MTRSHSVAAAFSAAAATYDQAAGAQAQAAMRLAALVAALPRPAAPRVLEIGCGTGLLTAALLPKLGGHWLVTDLSAAMVEAARRSFGARAEYRVMDGEHPDLEPGGFDLVVSNLAVQWFEDLGAGLARLRACLRPGGALAVSTLGAGSFAEWRAAHAALGLPCGTPAYPTPDAIAALLPGARVVRQPIAVEYADGKDFLDALRRVGASVPAPGHRPLSPGGLRKAMKALGSPARVTYDVVHLVAGA
ncbi:methyltransferase domain-containing protein [Magnetospirillum sp. UT-4]|uniref:methyltransferase domain-containing protein n=1 Tax=Magnetospirillum sp. UT-4 TaxID=2681467 RepID=UPI00137D95B2|nr:methyltransferase domain-containing protein [Magnetospirillum sp. UT-4]CAA7626516.1 putative methltransferase, enzyme of biotin synthesis [Magnetospirillum sp. UT-4]